MDDVRLDVGRPVVPTDLYQLALQVQKFQHSRTHIRVTDEPGRIPAQGRVYDYYY